MSAMRQAQTTNTEAPVRRQLAVWLAGALLAGAWFAPAAAQEAPPQRVAISIPAQPLLGALRAFGRQTQSQLLFNETLPANLQAVAVHGSFTPQEALERLLARTGVAIATVRARSFTLKLAPVEAALAAPAAAARRRPALVS